MKTLRPLILAALALLLRGAAGATVQLWLEGDSTLHPYSSTATTVGVDLRWPGGGPQDLPAALEANRPASLTVTVPVEGLKSDKDGLDKNLRKTLKADKHPEIVFAMKSYRYDKTSRMLTASGDLTVAGVTKAVDVRGMLSFQDGKAFLSGEHALKMTDFGIKPPKMMLGAIKTKDEVVVKFRLGLEN